MYICVLMFMCVCECVCVFVRAEKNGLLYNGKFGVNVIILGKVNSKVKLEK